MHAVCTTAFGFLPFMLSHSQILKISILHSDRLYLKRPHRREIWSNCFSVSGLFHSTSSYPAPSTLIQNIGFPPSLMAKRYSAVCASHTFLYLVTCWWTAMLIPWLNLLWIERQLTWVFRYLFGAQILLSLDISTLQWGNQTYNKLICTFLKQLLHCSP